MSLHDHEPEGRDRPLDVEGVPAEEGVDEADAAEELESSAEEKRNYTDDHPFDEGMVEGE